MPIIEPHDHRLPISQGDVLDGVTLFITNEKGEPKETNRNLCLVISRPCVAAHKSHVIVAAIEKMAGNPPRDIETFDDIRDFLTDMRDGVDSPDVFYLGQIPGLEGRFSARLDSLHTIQIPPESRRLGHLHIDFARDFHIRIFRAFAALGFDDHCWMSTEDLSWIVASGKSEVHSAESDLETANAALRKAEAQGDKIEGRKKLEKATL